MVYVTETSITLAVFPPLNWHASIPQVTVYGHLVNPTLFGIPLYLRANTVWEAPGNYSLETPDLPCKKNEGRSGQLSYVIDFGSAIRPFMQIAKVIN